MRFEGKLNTFQECFYERRVTSPGLWGGFLRRQWFKTPSRSRTEGTSIMLREILHYENGGT